MGFLRVQHCLVLQSEAYQPKPTHPSLFSSLKNFFSLFLVEKGNVEERGSKRGKHL